ncbi:MAG: ABC transporter ATP-binding protein [Elusimicrobia bacterium]|nr:ABC transporter ATP-binding protein [Elusimicrobiota bacterium]
MMKPLLEVKNLSVTVNSDDKEIEILQDISYKLYPSQTLAIVGESGSGKTLSALALVKLLPNSVSISSGSIIYNEKNLTKLTEDNLRKIRGSKISMIFQEPMSSLNPVLTIGKQISETIMAHKKISKTNALNQSAELLEKVGISNAKSRLKDYPHNFSGGMRQRVMIAIALSCYPDIVIADEPTTALDVTIQAQILKLMAKLRDERKMSMILITHNLGIVAQYADYALVFYAGKIMERAPVNRLLKNPAHPYTKALLDSLPKIKHGQNILKTIEGNPPNFEDKIEGCPFHPRCGEVMEKCKTSLPPEFKINNEHGSKCWRSKATKGY